jgi:hypothetical protein
VLSGSRDALADLFVVVERACRACRAWDARTGGRALTELIDGWESPALELLRGS